MSLGNLLSDNVDVFIRIATLLQWTPQAQKYLGCSALKSNGLVHQTGYYWRPQLMSKFSSSREDALDVHAIHVGPCACSRHYPEQNEEAASAVWQLIHGHSASNKTGHKRQRLASSILLQSGSAHRIPLSGLRTSLDASLERGTAVGNQTASFSLEQDGGNDMAEALHQANLALEHMDGPPIAFMVPAAAGLIAHADNHANEQYARRRVSIGGTAALVPRTSPLEAEAQSLMTALTAGGSGSLAVAGQSYAPAAGTDKAALPPPDEDFGFSAEDIELAIAQAEAQARAHANFIAQTSSEPYLSSSIATAGDGARGNRFPTPAATPASAAVSPHPPPPPLTRLAGLAPVAIDLEDDFEWSEEMEMAMQAVEKAQVLRVCPPANGQTRASVPVSADRASHSTMRITAVAPERTVGQPNNDGDDFGDWNADMEAAMQAMLATHAGSAGAAAQPAVAVQEPQPSLLRSHLDLSPAAVAKRLGAFADPDVTFPEFAPSVATRHGVAPAAPLRAFERMPIFLRLLVRSVSHDYTVTGGVQAAPTFGRAMSSIAQRVITAWYVEYSQLPLAQGLGLPAGTPPRPAAFQGGTRRGETLQSMAARVRVMTLVLRDAWLGCDPCVGDVLHVVGVQPLDGPGLPTYDAIERRKDERLRALTAGVDISALAATVPASAHPPRPLLSPDGGPVVLVDDCRHALVMHPDLLLAPTKIPLGSCMRKAVLSELLLEAGSDGGGSMVTALGTLKHSLFEHALTLVARGTLSEEAERARTAATAQGKPIPSDRAVLHVKLEAAALSLVLDAMKLEKLYAVGETAADADTNTGGIAHLQAGRAGSRASASAERLSADALAKAELLGCVPGIVDWFAQYMGVGGGTAAPAPVKAAPPVRVTGLYGTEQSLLSPVWGLKGFLDAAITADFSACGDGGVVHGPPHSGSEAFVPSTTRHVVGQGRVGPSSSAALSRAHVTVEYDINDSGMGGMRNMPLELKTGKRPPPGRGNFPEHQAQLLLYSLLMQERYGRYTEGEGGGRPSPAQNDAASSDAAGLLVFITSAEEQSKAVVGTVGGYSAPSHTDVPPPILHYTRSISLSWPEQRSILILRNAYTSALVKAKRSFLSVPAQWPPPPHSGAAGGSAGEGEAGAVPHSRAPCAVMPELPPIDEEERTCGKCYMFTTCSAVYAARELPWAVEFRRGRESDAAQRQGQDKILPQFLDELPSSTRHMFSAVASSMSPSTASYFDRWLRLVDIEEDAAARDKSDKGGSRDRTGPACGAGQSTALVQHGDAGPMDVTSCVGRAPVWRAASREREGDGVTAGRMVMVAQLECRAPGPVAQLEGGDDSGAPDAQGCEHATGPAAIAGGAMDELHALDELVCSPTQPLVLGETRDERAGTRESEGAVSGHAFLYVFITLESWVSGGIAAAHAATALASALVSAQGGGEGEGGGSSPPSQQGARSLLDLSLSRGSWVSVSGDARGPYALCAGSLVLVAPTVLVVRGDRDMKAAFPDGFGLPVGRSARDQSSGHLSPFLWRVDADESNAVTRIIKDNLMRLVAGPTITWPGEDEGAERVDAFSVMRWAGGAAGPSAPAVTARGANLGDVRRQRMLIDMIEPRFLTRPDWPWRTEATLGAAHLSSFPRAHPHSSSVRALQHSVTHTLNDEQRDAIGRVLSAQDYLCMLGMPGTGKTSTLVTAIRCLVAAGRSVLVASHTHSAVDTLLSKLVLGDRDGDGSEGGGREHISPDAVVRMGRLESVHPSMHPYTLEHALASGRVGSLRAMHSLLTQARVVGVTCLGVRHAMFSRRRFDVCIIDEASQISEPIALGPMRCARVFILVGDHFQLPPLVVSPIADAGGYGTSLFKRLCDAHPHAVVSLTRQYRMNEDIMSLSNEVVYRQTLRCGNADIAAGRYNLPHMDLLPEPLCEALERYTAQTVEERERAGARMQDGPVSASPLSVDWLRRALSPLTTVLFLDTDGAEGGQEGDEAARSPVQAAGPAPTSSMSSWCWSALESRLGGTNGKALHTTGMTGLPGQGLGSGTESGSQAARLPAPTDPAPRALASQLLGGKMKRYSKNSGSGPHGSGSGSLVNVVEAAYVASLVQGILLAGGSCKDIGIIAPYRSQLRLLKRCIADTCAQTPVLAAACYPGVTLPKACADASSAVAWADGVECDTVDRYQGRDKCVIIVSMVRSNTGGDVGSLLGDIRRLNVAFTRAKHKLIIVGSRTTLSNGSPELARLYELAGRRDWAARTPYRAHHTGAWYPLPLSIAWSVLNGQEVPPVPRVHTTTRPSAGAGGHPAPVSTSDSSSGTGCSSGSDASMSDKASVAVEGGETGEAVLGRAPPALPAPVGRRGNTAGRPVGQRGSTALQQQPHMRQDADDGDEGEDAAREEAEVGGAAGAQSRDSASHVMMSSSFAFPLQVPHALDPVRRQFKPPTLRGKV